MAVPTEYYDVLSVFSLIKMVVSKTRIHSFSAYNTDFLVAPISLGLLCTTSNVGLSGFLSFYSLLGLEFGIVASTFRVPTRLVARLGFCFAAYRAGFLFFLHQVSLSQLAVGG